MSTRRRPGEYRFQISFPNQPSRFDRARTVWQTIVRFRACSPRETTVYITVINSRLPVSRLPFVVHGYITRPSSYVRIYTARIVCPALRQKVYDTNCQDVLNMNDRGSAGTVARRRLPKAGRIRGHIFTHGFVSKSVLKKTPLAVDRLDGKLTDFRLEYELVQRVVVKLDLTLIRILWLSSVYQLIKSPFEIVNIWSNSEF